MRGTKPPTSSWPPPKTLPAFAFTKKIILRHNAPFPKVSCSPALKWGNEPEIMKGSVWSQAPLWQLQHRHKETEQHPFWGNMVGTGGRRHRIHQHRDTHRHWQTHINIHLYRSDSSIYPQDLAKSLWGRLGKSPYKCPQHLHSLLHPYTLKGGTAGSRLPCLRRSGTSAGAGGGSRLWLVVFRRWKGPRLRALPDFL